MASGGGKVEGNPAAVRPEFHIHVAGDPWLESVGQLDPGIYGVHHTPLALWGSCSKGRRSQVHGFEILPNIEILPNAGTDQRQIGNSSSHRPAIVHVS
jgi:hypothetical protein